MLLIDDVPEDERVFPVDLNFQRLNEPLDITLVFIDKIIKTILDYLLENSNNLNLINIHEELMNFIKKYNNIYFFFNKHNQIDTIIKEVKRYIDYKDPPSYQDSYINNQRVRLQNSDNSLSESDEELSDSNEELFDSEPPPEYDDSNNDDSNYDDSNDDDFTQVIEPIQNQYPVRNQYIVRNQYPVRNRGCECKKFCCLCTCVSVIAGVVVFILFMTQVISYH